METSNQDVNQTRSSVLARRALPIVEQHAVDVPVAVDDVEEHDVPPAIAAAEGLAIERKAIEELRLRLQAWRYQLSDDLPGFDEADWLSRSFGPRGLFDETRHVITLVRNADDLPQARKIARELISLLDEAERAYAVSER